MPQNVPHSFPLLWNVKSIICLIILDSKETALEVFQNVTSTLWLSGLNSDNICNSSVW